MQPFYGTSISTPTASDDLGHRGNLEGSRQTSRGAEQVASRRPTYRECATDFCLNRVEALRTTVERLKTAWRRIVAAVGTTAGLIVACVALWATISAPRDGHKSEVLAEWTARKEFLEFCKSVRRHQFIPPKHGKLLVSALFRQILKMLAVMQPKPWSSALLQVLTGETENAPLKKTRMSDGSDRSTHRLRVILSMGYPSKTNCPTLQGPSAFSQRRVVFSQQTCHCFRTSLCTRSPDSGSTKITGTHFCIWFCLRVSVCSGSPRVDSNEATVCKRRRSAVGG
ncbi:hypothetical protein B0H63DRAFT_2097 [Podospora didyma]|uniref:Transmembrane protein n=1 Tax=Podospora didyma TaxID=330526 RepID=A0AAE0P414_9PEZI|nr:hypothetical protein B0H63DRAFT_2097 [Podospora didyma]